jgi:hypothetical protein
MWWTYTWRGIVYLVVLLVATNVPLGFVTGAITVISPALGQAFSQLMGLVIAAAVGLFVIYSNPPDLVRHRVGIPGVVGAPTNKYRTAPNAASGRIG